MTKIRLNTAHRNTLKEYGQQKIASLIDRTRENELYSYMLEAANKAIRSKYPERDMRVLRHYDLTSTDYCLKFQFPSGRVDGFSFKKDDSQPLSDIPYRRGCGYGSGNVYPMDEGFEAAYDEHAKVAEANKKERWKKDAEFYALIEAAKTLDDVLEVIDLPPDILERLGRKSTALVALSTDTLERLKADFALKAA